MNYVKLACILGGAACANPASAASVYSGCSVPTQRTTRNTFYVDPVKGSMSGDGSAAKPWSTLADVLNPANKLVSTQSHSSGYAKGTDTALHATNPTAPIKAGDLILLRTGNHGSPTLTNMYNSDFITIAAAPGAVPVVGRLSVVSSAKWLFSGLTFEAAATATTGATTIQSTSANLVQTGQGDYIGTTSDIVFDADTFRTAASTSGWSKYDWYNKPYSVALALRAPCGAVTNSHFQNVYNAIFITAPQNLVQGNTIEDFSNDGLDITASKLLIKNNTIRLASVNSVDPLHSDGIQGWSVITNGVPVTNTNVVIDGNIISQPRDSSISMQGISVFDGTWSGLVLQNNVVTTNHWHGMAVYGGQNTSVLNNTVIAADPVHYPSWITIHDAKDGTKATALVRNNIATQIVIQSPGTTLDHNMAASSISTPTGKITSGSTGTANTVNAAVLGGFLNLNTTSRIFDMRLKPTSVAVGQGVVTGAPTLDLLGRSRTTPVDLGAYIHEGAALTNAVSRVPQTASSSP